MRILVLDIGTTSMRGILYDEYGTQLALSRRENHLILMGDSLIEENPDDWYHNSVSIIREICQAVSADTFDMIAVTSQRSSIIPVDREGMPLSAAIMWQDTRNRQICRQLEQYNPQLYEKTGAEVSTVFSGSKMTWIRQNLPEIYPSVYKFLNIPEYVVSRMCGVYVSDTTYASRTGLMDLRTETWDPDILKLYEVEENKLCRLIQPGETAGYVNKEFAEACGIEQGIPVIHSGGDQQCAAIGHGIIEEGPVSVTVGTGGFLASALCQLPEQLPKGMIINRSSAPGQYIMESNVLTCGAAYDWCAKQLYGMNGVNYRLLEEELKKENFVSSALVIPYFSGKGAPDWNPMADALISHVTTATRRSEIFKSVMESVFMEISSCIDRFADTVSVTKVYSGGGLTGSAVLNQLQSDIYGRRLICFDDPEATAKGALAVALSGMKVYPDLHTAFETVCAERSESVYEPNRSLHEQYLKKREKMNRLYQLLKEGGFYES